MSARWQISAFIPTVTPHFPEERRRVIPRGHYVRCSSNARATLRSIAARHSHLTRAKALHVPLRWLAVTRFTARAALQRQCDPRQGEGETNGHYRNQGPDRHQPTCVGGTRNCQSIGAVAFSARCMDAPAGPADRRRPALARSRGRAGGFPEGIPWLSRDPGHQAIL